MFDSCVEVYEFVGACWYMIVGEIELSEFIKNKESKYATKVVNKGSISADPNSATLLVSEISNSPTVPPSIFS